MAVPILSPSQTHPRLSKVRRGLRKRGALKVITKHSDKDMQQERFLRPDYPKAICVATIVQDVHLSCIFLVTGKKSKKFDDQYQGFNYCVSMF